MLFRSMNCSSEKSEKKASEKKKVKVSCLTLSDYLQGTPWTIALQVLLSMELSKNTGVGSYSLIQGIFPTLGSNLVSCIAGRF